MNPARRRLIVNADDFGRSAAINAAVLRAHQGGILTTASLMVNECGFEEAVTLARRNPRLGVGLHLTLLCGHSSLPPDVIPGLVNARSEFTNNPAAAGLKYFFNRNLKEQLSQEVCAQLEKFHSTGLPLDHINGHLHMHLHPTIFRIVLQEPGGRGTNTDDQTPNTKHQTPNFPEDKGQRTALPHSASDFRLAEYPIRDTRHGTRQAPLEQQALRISRMRLTFDPLRLNLRVASGHLAYRLLHTLIFHSLAARARPVLKRRGIRHTDAVFGLLQNARVDEGYVLRLLPELPAGDSELYSHPCLEHFKNEFEALISPRVRALVKELGIELIRYQDL